MTARLRYVAYVTEQPEALAGFYRGRLQLEEIGRSPTGDISLTDGFVRLALFRSREDLGEARMEVGLHHIGFRVESIEAVKARYRRLCPRGVMVPESGSHRGDIRLYDPECHPVSLSEKDFGLSSSKDAAPKLRYLAFGALDPEAQADFYVRVFGLQPLAEGGSTSGGRPDRAVTDGQIILAFHDYFAPRDGLHARYGLRRCGFAAREGAGRLDLADPDGNPVILAQPGGMGVESWRA